MYAVFAAFPPSPGGLRSLIPGRAGASLRRRLTLHHDDLTVRPITGPDELDLFNRFPHPYNDEWRADPRDGHRRPGWLWIALHRCCLVARAGWWARRGDEHPRILDLFDLDPYGRPETVDIGVHLLSTAMAEVVPDGTCPPEHRQEVDPGLARRTGDPAAHGGPHGRRGADRRADLRWNG